MAESRRLIEDKARLKNWKRWGPYLSERQWGTVREDYSGDGNCWDYFPHDHARSRAYRWGEDGLMGICDRQCRLCFSVALWNGKDPILKERLYGLTGPQGNHGEDVKECYYYMESSPTHSYFKGLYKYPQAEYPYSNLEHENARRGLWDPEFELEDAGVLDNGAYWDVHAEYAKNTPNDILIKITVTNRSDQPATIHVLPTLWFRNTWIWGCTHEGCTGKPKMKKVSIGKVECTHESFSKYSWEVDQGPDGHMPAILFTENETNTKLLYGEENYTPYVKDAFNRYVIDGETTAINPKYKGTKAAAHYVVTVSPGMSVDLRSRLYQEDETPAEMTFGAEYEEVLDARKNEAEEYFQEMFGMCSMEEQKIARQAMAGLQWSKQFYHYVVHDWLEGDPEMPPPASRLKGRNSDWTHLFNRDIISMPDKWEYPWYASWDLAFHVISYATFDIEFAKDQLILFLREWYMHPNGQIPAYEFALGDVNPPVHAYAVIKVFKATGPRGMRDTNFLARCFQKLILNFTWWINRKDPDGNNIFSGGFLGLDNIGVFDRSKPLPLKGHLEQADGTAWMAFFCLVMLDMALILAAEDQVYSDMASKFFEHFILIVDAMNKVGQGGGLWHEGDGFYYDYIRTHDGKSIPMKIRSLVGLVPLFSCLVLEDKRLKLLPGFSKRMQWFLGNRKDLSTQISYMIEESEKGRLLLAIPTKERLARLLNYLLDENEFLSPYGIRSLSKVHEEHPFILHLGNEEYRVDYIPGESRSDMFGGNSNWRGPIWFPMNFLLIEVLKRYHYYYGDRFKVECPTGSGNFMHLEDVAQEISSRLVKLFLPDENGVRPCHGDSKLYTNDPACKELVLFHEYFHGDTGRGCGASHQTGWTALVLNCMMMCRGFHHGGLARYKFNANKAEEKIPA